MFEKNSKIYKSKLTEYLMFASQFAVISFKVIQLLVLFAVANNLLANKSSLDTIVYDRGNNVFSFAIVSLKDIEKLNDSIVLMAGNQLFGDPISIKINTNTKNCSLIFNFKGDTLENPKGIIDMQKFLMPRSIAKNSKNRVFGVNDTTLAELVNDSTWDVRNIKKRFGITLVNRIISFKDEFYFQTKGSLFKIFSLDSIINIFNSNDFIKDADSLMYYNIPISYILTNMTEYCFDKVGNLWYSTYKTLMKYDGKKLIYFDSTNSDIYRIQVFTDYVTPALVDNENSIFTFNRGYVFKYDGDKFNLFVNLNDYLKLDSGTFYYDHSFDSKNRLWLLTNARVMMEDSIKSSFFRLWVLDFKNNIYEEYDIPKEYKYVLGNSLLAYSIKIDDKDRLFLAQRQRLLYTKESITSVIENTKIENELSVFPNPATDYITINLERCATFQKSGTSVVEIYDVMGILVSRTSTYVFNGNNAYGQTGTSNPPRIDISNLTQGVYFLKIIGSKGACSLVEKFVKY